MKKNIFSGAMICLVATCFLSCKNDPVPTQPRTDIHLDSTDAVAGRHLVDKDGKTLYFFSNDANGLSNCSGGCATNWPAFAAEASATFGDGLAASDFAEITLASGGKQTTYKGWPLYYYAPGGVPEAAGQATGEGVGSVWFVAKTNYSVMITNFQLTGNNGINYLSNYAPGDGRTAYFSDGNGNTLYAFAKDSSLQNKFTKPDFSNNANWPIYETENITVPSILDKSFFVVTTFNGKKQLTYKGWPMYYFGPDAMVRGANKGISVGPTPGSVWPVIVKESAAAPTP